MDRAPFIELAIAEWSAVHGFALRLTGDPHLADDLSQEVYTQAFRPERIASFEPRGGGLRSWLLRITYRAFLALAQRRQRDGALFAELEVDPADGREALDAGDAARFNWEGIDGRLRDAVARLDRGSREVLLLWAVDGLQYREIADILGIPAGTVMSRLHRARTRTANSLLADPRGADEFRSLPKRTVRLPKDTT